MSLRKGFNYLVVFALLLSPLACLRVTGITSQFVELNNKEAQHDSATNLILRPYKDSVDKLMNVVIGHTAVQMPKESGKMETLLGNFVTDISLSQCNKKYKSPDNLPADICIMNTGGLRSSIPKGAITRSNIFELMPFDNELVVLTLSGQKTWELLKFVAMTAGEPIAGMSIGIDSEKKPKTSVIQGQAFDSTKTYKILTSDYLASSGTKMRFLTNPIKYEKTGYLIRDAILDYFAEETAKGNIITSKLDGRFYYDTK
jgi:2',3'-cyclic-nucleotide 2'-phosphodiesterase (5'-nucleotidase family)